MKLTITYDPVNDFSVLTDDDERVCLPYGLNNLPPKLEKKNWTGAWTFVKNMTVVEFEAWCDHRYPDGSTRIPRI